MDEILKLVSRIEEHRTKDLEVNPVRCNASHLGPRQSRDSSYISNFFTTITVQAVTYQYGDGINSAVIRDAAQLCTNELMTVLLNKLDINEFDK